MVKILEKTLKVSRKIHRKKTKTGIKEYAYGTISLDDPRLLEYAGKQVKITIKTG